MAIPPANTPPDLAELASYLFTRREAILNNWRTAFEQDPAVKRRPILNREEFNDLIPVILDILEQRFLGQTQEADPTVTAITHGLQRWQKAYPLLDNMRELYHLEQSLFNEILAFYELFPQTDPKLLLQIQQQIAQLISETIEGSVQKYDELQRLEAANRANALQQAIDHMQTMARQRGDLLRTSSHDLKSSFGIISSAASLLHMDGLSEQERDQYTAMLNRNLTAVHTMLNSLMDLSRLEAGEEALQLQSTDVAQFIREIVTNAQPMANERGLVLKADGPDSLLVLTDPVKLQRIVQNLLVNAIQYTPTGFISVSWAREGEAHWQFSVQDSGPGLQGNLTTLLARQLKPMVEPRSSTNPTDDQPATQVPSGEAPITSGPVLSKELDSTTRREGVGLQIVKRLCEMLTGNLDVETQIGRGTLFRIRLPLHLPG